MYDGSTLYLGGAKSDPGGSARAVAIPYSRGKLGTQREAHLAGYFATALAVSGDSPHYDPAVRFYVDAGLSSSTDLSLTGDIAQAEVKSWMASIGDYLYVACNLSGVAVIGTGSKSIVAGIPALSLDTAIVP